MEYDSQDFGLRQNPHPHHLATPSIYDYNGICLFNTGAI
nr:MAG TPA: hypothetical protein [Caudoviricetes sp.]